MAAVPGGSRTRIDYLTPLGVVLSVAVVVGGNLLEGGHTNSLIQLTAFMIVFGGTLGAILVQTPLPDFLHAMRRFIWVFRSPRYPRRALLNNVLGWSRVARQEGLLALEQLTAKESDPFVRKGLSLLVDGVEPEEIRSIMEVAIDSRLTNEASAARVYESMGGYSPTIGIIGAVLGLIHVMNNLSDPAELGSGIAVAFVATIYGVGFANFFFLPISNKLKSIYGEQVRYREMVVDGMVMIADGENPRSIQNKLEGYLDGG